jgi:alkylation response protein AidB-like acyl-CoA dehydrogenase
LLFTRTGAKSRPLIKIGLHAQDTTMVFFEEVRVPNENVLGGVPGQGFIQLMKELAWERLAIEIFSISGAQAADPSWLLRSLPFCHRKACRLRSFE